MGNKINDPSLYPATTPAETDRVLGVDVSNTSNDANGEVVTFTVEALRNATAYATAAQGAKADTALQPGDNVSDLVNDAGYTTATGTVDTSGTPVALDFARFTDANTIEGLSYAEVKAALDLEIGTDVQAYSADLTTFLGANTLPDGNGTDGQVLTSDGAGGTAWEDAGGGGGGLVPIGAPVVASTSSAVDIALTGGYSAYAIRLTQITVSTDNVEFRLRTSTNGGSTFDGGASDYAWSFNRLSTSSTHVDDLSDSQIAIASPVGSAAGEGISGGWIYIFPSTGSVYKSITFQLTLIDVNGIPAVCQGGGFRYSATAFDAVRFFFSTGAFSGTLQLYGVADGA